MLTGKVNFPLIFLVKFSLPNAVNLGTVSLRHRFLRVRCQPGEKSVMSVSKKAWDDLVSAAFAEDVAAEGVSARALSSRALSGRALERSSRALSARALERSSRALELSSRALSARALSSRALTLSA